jgi:hypothetical protein
VSERIVIMQEIPIEVWMDAELLGGMNREWSAREAADTEAATRRHVTTDDQPELRVAYMRAVIEGDDVTEIEVAREDAEFVRVRSLFQVRPRG